MKQIIVILCLTIACLAWNKEQSISQQYLNIFQKMIEDSMDPLTYYASKLLTKTSSFRKVELDNTKYFDFLPHYVKNLKVGESLDYEEPCFKSTSFKFGFDDKKSKYVLDVDVLKPSSMFCSTLYLIAYQGGYKIENYFLQGKSQVVFEKPGSDATVYDLQTYGVRIFRFDKTIESTLASITQTALLFEPAATKGVNQLTAEQNIAFLKYTSGIDMKKRSVTNVAIDESLIKSGDFIGIMRLDGVDQMLAWGMGSSTGHTTVAQRIDGVLHVCESQAKQSYWPVNGIQCTEFNEWIKLADEADFQVVWLPLSKEMSELYDEQKAYEYFKTVEGVNYGFPTLLTGWIDTYKGNFPCLPHDMNRCLHPLLLDVAFTIVEGIDRDIAVIWRQAMGRRAGLNGNDFKLTDAYYAAAQKGINITDIYQIVEQDSWLYVQEHNNGSMIEAPSSVCCVFVCKMWKAAGIFGNFTDTINCGELDNLDDTKLDIFDHDFKRPEACEKADPENPLCQLLGTYTLRLDKAPGKDVHFNNVPNHAHYGDHCPNTNPDYIQPVNC